MLESRIQLGVLVILFYFLPFFYATTIQPERISGALAETGISSDSIYASPARKKHEAPSMCSNWPRPRNYDDRIASSSENEPILPIALENTDCKPAEKSRVQMRNELEEVMRYACQGDEDLLESFEEAGGYDVLRRLTNLLAWEYLTVILNREVTGWGLISGTVRELLIEKPILNARGEKLPLRGLTCWSSLISLENFTKMMQRQEQSWHEKWCEEIYRGEIPLDEQFQRLETTTTALDRLETKLGRDIPELDELFNQAKDKLIRERLKKGWHQIACPFFGRLFHNLSRCCGND